MAKKQSLAGFGSVANTNNVVKNNNETENNANNNINTNTNISTNDSTENRIGEVVEINTITNIDNDFKTVIDNVIGVQTVQPKKKQISAYVDEDVAKMLDRFGKKYGKGAKSNLINELLRNSLK